MVERDAVDPGDPVARWVLIGHSTHQHYRTSVQTFGAGPRRVDVHRAACGYDYQKGFELILEGDLGLPRCPRCLAAMAETAMAGEGRR